MSAQTGLEQLTSVLLVALIALLAFILLKRMAVAMRKRETQGIFTEFATDRDERDGDNLIVRIRVPNAAGEVGIPGAWEDPQGKSEVLWTRTLPPGEHALEFNLAGRVPGRHSYRLVASQQVLQRFISL